LKNSLLNQIKFIIKNIFDKDFMRREQLSEIKIFKNDQPRDLVIICPKK